MLAMMARDYLAVQGSSVPSECIFSSAARIDDDRRNSLLPKTFSAVQMLKSHCKAIRRHRELDTVAKHAISIMRRCKDLQNGAIDSASTPASTSTTSTTYASTSRVTSSSAPFASLSKPSGSYVVAGDATCSSGTS